MSNKTFPPKFSQDILYPAILNLDEIDMSGSPVGDISLGTYFNISFGNNAANQSPSLSYGKHGFRISINPNPEQYGYPRLKQSSRILFEIKDSNGLVIFSDTTPLHSSGNLQFTGYLWIKQDPLRTYEEIIEGNAIMTVVSKADIPDPHWRNIYNVRSSISLNLDLTTQVTNDDLDFSTQLYYNPNNSPIIFKNPNNMTSASGALFISESIIETHSEFVENSQTGEREENVFARQSIVNISASHLHTFSGQVSQINVAYWISGSVDGGFGTEADPKWVVLGSRLLINSDGTYYSTTFEESIHTDYAQGLNPISAEWSHPVPSSVAPDGIFTKMRFRLKFTTAAGDSALNTYPFSGSAATGNEFSLEYPDPGWLSFGGSGLRLPDSTIFGSGNSLLIETGAGQFTLNTAPYLTQVGMGLTYGPEGNPNTPPEPHDDNHPN